jgi:hypothetical protein
MGREITRPCSDFPLRGACIARRVGGHSALAHPRSQRAEPFAAGVPRRSTRPPGARDPRAPTLAGSKSRLAHSGHAGPSSVAVIGPLGVRKRQRPRHPAPDPHAGDPVVSGDMAAPPARRIESPPSRGHSLHFSSRTLVNWEGGGEIRPAGLRSHLACACGHRAGVSRRGVAGVVSYEQRGAPPRDVPARSHAEAGRRAGLDAQPERPLVARGAKQALHAVKKRNAARRAKHKPARSGRQEVGGRAPGYTTQVRVS